MVGLCYLIAKRRFLLPIWLLVVLIVMSESEQFVVVISGIICGILIYAVWNEIVHNPSALQNNLSTNNLQGGIFLILIILMISWYGYNSISKNHPKISEETLKLSSYVKESTSPDSTFLVVAGPNEAEWFPYLFKRNPVVGHWGSEWTDNYSEQIGYIYRVQECELKQDANCLENLLLEFPETPDFLITHNASEKLNKGIQGSNSWRIGYKNDDYILWNLVDK